MNIKINISGITKEEYEHMMKDCNISIYYGESEELHTSVNVSETEKDSFQESEIEVPYPEDDIDEYVPIGTEDLLEEDLSDKDTSDEDTFDKDELPYDEYDVVYIDDDGTEWEPEKSGHTDRKSDPPQTIDDLELSVRSFNCLKRAGIETIEQLIALSDDDLRKVRNLGYKSYCEIKCTLKEYMENGLIPYGALGSESSEKETATIKKPKIKQPDYFAELDALVGLDDVKKQVRKIKALARMKQDIPQDPARFPIVLNMEFVGNPGTAKTTVARIIAGILAQTGILKSGEIVEVGRADLVAKYEGQTAEKVRSVFARSRGRLLFIDEAYSLVENCRGEFGDEAISTIVQEMENHRDDTVVVFAGYPENMEEFFSINPGLRSRVPFKITFKDYSVEEMLEIARIEAEKRGFLIDVKASDKIRELCSCKDLDIQKGNGRFSRNLVEGAILNYALRVYGDDELQKEDWERWAANGILLSDDFEMPENMIREKKEMAIGFCA